MMDISKGVEEYLREYHNTEDNAILAKDLGTLFNCKGKPLRDIVNLLRSNGVPICSSLYGYWYSELPSDIDRTLSQLEGRVTHISKAINGLRGYLEVKAYETICKNK